MLVDPRGRPIQSPAPPAGHRRADGLARALAGGRQTVAGATGQIGAALSILAPNTPEEFWRTYTLDHRTLDRLPATQLLELLVDLSPDVSRAYWDFLRFCNPGFEVHAYQPGKEGDVLHPQGEAALQDFIGRLEDRHGSLDVLIGRLFAGAFVRGAYLIELVLDRRGRFPVDLAIPDPAWVRFRRVDDPERGAVWELGQWIDGAWHSLDIPTIRYVPVDPMPDSPYGRPIAAPAIFTSLFLLGLLHDLRRVVSQQGYPRIGVKVVVEKLGAFLPSAPADQKEFIDDTIGEVQAIYAALEPDDAFVHTDAIEIERPVGAVDSSSLGAIDGLMKNLERQAVRALKTMPLLMGTTDGVSEANANRQTEAHAASIKALQHLAETVLERLLNLALQVQGIQAAVQFRFAELRAAELMRDAQTEAIVLQNVETKYRLGYIGQVEASQLAVGHNPDVPEPRTVTPPPTDAADDAMDVVADPGSNRQRRSSTRQVVGGDAPLSAAPSTVEIEDNDLARASAEWDVRLPEYAGLLDAKVVDDADKARSNGHGSVTDLVHSR